MKRGRTYVSVKIQFNSSGYANSESWGWKAMKEAVDCFELDQISPFPMKEAASWNCIA
jgi:hypothetical protein